MQVSSSALLQKEGKSFVYVYSKEEQTVSLCEVTRIRPLNNGKTIILSNQLKPGDIVVSAGVYTIKVGEKVQPIAPVSPTNIGGLL